MNSYTTLKDLLHLFSVFVVRCIKFVYKVSIEQIKFCEMRFYTVEESKISAVSFLFNMILDHSLKCSIRKSTMHRNHGSQCIERNKNQFSKELPSGIPKKYWELNQIKITYKNKKLTTIIFDTKKERIYVYKTSRCD